MFLDSLTKFRLKYYFISYEIITKSKVNLAINFQVIRSRLKKTLILTLSLELYQSAALCTAKVVAQYKFCQ